MTVSSVKNRQIPAAAQLLIVASTPGSALESITAVPMTPADWTDLPSQAQRHGLTALAAPAIAKRPDVPPAIVHALNESVRRTAVRALTGASQLVGIVRELEREAIPAVALKGPAFSQWLYGSASVRRFGDLDLLVLPGHRDRAARVLSALGYDLPAGMSARAAAAIYAGLGAWPLSADGRLPVDLHWRQTHVRFPSPLRAQQIVGESVTIALGGATVRVPCATHAALLTLLHAAKHIWSTLEIVLSIRMMAERPDVDWMRVRKLATYAHAWNGCAAGLRLASELMNAPLPREMVRSGWPESTRGLVREALAALSLPPGQFPDRWSERRAHRAAVDRVSDRVRYDLLRIAAPTPLDWRWCRLPDRLSFLYVPLRLLRLSVSAASGSLDPDPRPSKQESHALGSF